MAINLPSPETIWDLVKAGATLDAKEKIMELRRAALEQHEQNLTLRARVLELEERVRELERIDGEKCPKCSKLAWVIEKTEPDPTMGVLGVQRRTYRCTACGFSEYTQVG